MPVRNDTSAAADKPPTKESSVSSFFHAELALAESLPNNFKQSFKSELKENWPHLAVEAGVSLVVGAAVAAVSRNPALVGRVVGQVISHENPVALGESMVKYVKPVMTALPYVFGATAVADAGHRIAVPALDLAQHPENKAVDEKLFANNVSSLTQDAIVTGVSGFAGVRFGMARTTPFVKSVSVVDGSVPQNLVAETPTNTLAAHSPDAHAQPAPLVQLAEPVVDTGNWLMRSAVVKGRKLIDVADVPHENPEVVKAQSYQKDSAASAPWRRTAPMRQRYASLEGRHEADVVVVGGGVVGLQTAHELGSYGINTVVLDRGLVGSGTSSFMGAMGTYAEDPGFKAILDSHGEDGFRSRLRELTTSRASVQQLARLYGADWKNVNSYNVSYEDNDAALQAEVDLLHRFNDMEPRFVTGDAASKIFAPAKSAVIFPNEGNLNPYKFSLGLAGSGKFTVHENSPVLGIAVGAKGDGVDVFSPSGTIHAKKVVFATNGPAPMFSFLNDHLEPVQCFATTADIGQHLPGNFFDTDPGAFTYWRQFGVKPFGKHETLIGGTARFLNEMTAEPDAPRLAARVSSLFNGAQAKDPVSALIFTAYSDGLPVASPHPDYPDVWTATGAGGTGLVNGNLMARTIRTQFQTPGAENLISATRFVN